MIDLEEWYLDNQDLTTSVNLILRLTTNESGHRILRKLRNGYVTRKAFELVIEARTAFESLTWDDLRSIPWTLIPQAGLLKDLTIRLGKTSQLDGISASPRKLDRLALVHTDPSSLPVEQLEHRQRRL